ncbi:MAG: alpha-galactosidase, partial [Pseudonocardiales bacterium]|nr:alpha-galactosidase [Pseudonocardiales bacterium]
MPAPRSVPLMFAVVGALALSVLGLFAVSTARTAQAVLPASSVALARTPPMGYNNWAAVGCAADDPHVGDTGPSGAMILAQAKALVSTGLAAAGYKTVTVDDCWMQTTRDSSGNLRPTSSFPDMKGLGDQIHGLGLNFGIYEDSGTTTCDHRAGSWGHYPQDANLFASWGVDYVKLDGCHMPSGQTSVTAYRNAYAAFAAALQATGRPIVLSDSAPAYFYDLYRAPGVDPGD